MTLSKNPRVDLDLTAAKWQAGRLPSEDLPRMAQEMLEAGIDTPSLRVVAGLTLAELDDARDWFDKAMRELDRQRLPERWVANQLLREIAQEIVDGKVDPPTGARRMWDTYLEYEGYLSDANELTTFVAFDDLWEEYPDQRAEIAAEIVATAKQVLQTLD